MRLHTRRKMTAVFGLLSMSLGALMVLVPSGAGAVEPAQPGALAAECRAALGVSDDTLVYGAKWEKEGQYESLAGFSAAMKWTEDEDSTLFEFSGASDLVYVLAVKQASDPLYLATWPDGVYSGTYDYSNTKTPPDGDFSHVTLCGYDKTEPPATGSLSVDKVVTGGDPEEAADLAFGFSLTCTLDGGPYAVEPATFTLTDADPPQVFPGMPAGTLCTLTETEDHDADSTLIKVGAGAPVEVHSVSNLEIVSGTTLAVVVTNSFGEIPPPPPPPPPPPVTVPVDEAEPASLTVEKAVAGLDAPDEWSFGFRVAGLDVEREFALDELEDAMALEDLAAGEYTITETLEAGDLSALTVVSCLQGTEEMAVEVDGRTATVVLEEGAEVTCRFTNTYPQVLPDEVTPTTTPATTPPAPQTVPPPAPEVKGDVVLRQLPYTGAGTRNLAIVGVALIGLGAGMVLYERRRTAMQG